MYKAIIFDLDNTLLDFDRCETDSMQRAILHHNVAEQREFEFVWETFWQTFLRHNLSYWEQRTARNLTILQILELALRDTFGGLGPPSLPEQLSKTYWDFFCSTCHFEKDAPEILSWAKRNHKLGIVSNGIGEAQHRRLQTGDTYHYFDAIIVSDEVGYWKPDARIFHAALEQLDTQRHEVLFVGDSLRNDYYGALNAGIDFCYYNRKRQQLNENIKPKHIITELAELKSII